MKILLSSVLSLVALAAGAHESLAPHDHPHGVSMLPDLGAIAVGAVLLAAGLLAWLSYRRS
jgi:hypothetical protein